jgi:Bacterial Ig-like domain (group 3)
MITSMGKTTNHRIRTIVLLVGLALLVGLGTVAYASPQQQRSATVSVGVQPQFVLLQQGSNLILKIRLAHGVFVTVWADNSCDTPKNNAVTFAASGTYTIPIQSVKGQGERYACLLSSDGLQRATLSLRDDKRSTASIVTSSINPVIFGQSITFTASVSFSDGGFGVPSGAVTFQDGSNTLGTGTLNGSAVATFATIALSVGAHSITAVYGGDTNFTTSTSSVLTQTVNQSATATTVTSSVDPSVSGQSVTFTANVNATGGGAGAVAGTVTFKDGAATLGTGTLNGSDVAMFATTALSVNAHSITAVYGGNTSFAASTSAVLTQTVHQSPTTTIVTSSANPSKPGKSVTFTATVSASGAGTGTPTGTVTFKDGSSTLGSGTPTGSGVATLSTSALSTGSHAITATYSGATNFSASTSSVLTQTVK